MSERKESAVGELARNVSIDDAFEVVVVRKGEANG